MLAFICVYYVYQDDVKYRRTIHIYAKDLERAVDKWSNIRRENEFLDAIFLPTKWDH
jgi:hypothetical protein